MAIEAGSYCRIISVKRCLGQWILAASLHLSIEGCGGQRPKPVALVVVSMDEVACDRGRGNIVTGKRL